MNKQLILPLFVLLAFYTSSSQAIKVACVGDSITDGANISDREVNSYPAQLESILQKFNIAWETENFGVGGATLLSQGDLPYVEQQAYNQALSWNPDVVVIMLGTNDSKYYNWVYKDEFVPDYLAFIDSFTALPSQPQIWICKPVPAFKLVYSITNEVIRDEIIPLIDEIAGQRDVRVIDLYTPLLGASDLFPDGIHPNAEGAGLMAEIIAPMLLGIRSEPDFNLDGVVNFIDYLILIEHFTTEDISQSDIQNSSESNNYDLAPTPDGDGIVDLRDVAALFKYWLKTPGLLAYWKLDETEGTLATDCAGEINGQIHGNAVWHPSDGYKGGALELNGTDSYVKTNFVINPIDGPFSVFVWTKGGQPGQVLIAQESGREWIGVDFVTGGLRTKLTDGGRSTTTLISDVPFTNDQWHQILLIWDGSLRHIYVDRVEVAVDSKPLKRLTNAEGGLYFGASTNLDESGFWMGMIDDIRIYDKVLLP